MAVSDLTLARDDLVKTLAVVINTHHKTDRTAGGDLVPVTLRVTTARHLRDGADLFVSRMLHDHQLEESTGARNPPALGQRRLPPGTSIKGGTEPNTFSFGVDNRRDPTDATLDDWRNYALKGSEIIVYRGAERDGTGAAYGFDDYEERFYGRIRAAQRRHDRWQIEAVSPEGRNADRMLVRRTYLGLGYGIELDNTGGASVDWLQGTSPSAFVPAAAGKWAFSGIFNFLSLPSDVVGVTAFTIIAYDDRVVVRIRESDDKAEVYHHDGVSSSAFLFNSWVMDSSHVGRPIAFGVRHDGSMLYLYVDGEQADSVATTKDPTNDATVLRIGRNAVDVEPGSFTVYELWVSDDDPGDNDMRARQGGPLTYDRPNQADLWDLYKFLEGSGTDVADLIFDGAENDLTVSGTASWVDSAEGDKPSVSPRPQGETKPFLLGHVFNLPATLREIADRTYEIAPYAVEIGAARVDGSPLQIGYTATGTYRLRTGLGPDSRSAIESADLAAIVIPPFLDEAGQILQAGSQIEISGGHAEDGVWYCTGIEGGLFVFVDDGGNPASGFSAEDLSASITITVPAIGTAADVTDNGDGTFNTDRTLSGVVTVDVERTAGTTPTADASLIWLRNARDRAESATIDSASFTDNHDVDWITGTGATGEHTFPWSLAIPGGRDLSFRDAEAKLLGSYFAWCSDTARVDIDPGPGITLAEGIRAGQYWPPDGSGTVFSADQVVEESIEELDTLPPAWRIVVRYRPNYNPERQLVAGISPAMRRALAADFSELEVFRDESIRDDFDGAREIVWDTLFWEEETAALVGQRLRAFLREPRTWWRFRMEIRPEAVLIGENISVPHERFQDAGAVDMVVYGKRHAITRRGVDLVAVS